MALWNRLLSNVYNTSFPLFIFIFAFVLVSTLSVLFALLCCTLHSAYIRIHFSLYLARDNAKHAHLFRHYSFFSFCIHSRIHARSCKLISIWYFSLWKIHLHFSSWLLFSSLGRCIVMLWCNKLRLFLSGSVGGGMLWCLVYLLKLCINYLAWTEQYCVSYWWGLDYTDCALCKGYNSCASMPKGTSY